MSYIKSLLQQLAELYQHMYCGKCKSPFQSPVRNRRCGDYYCQKCLEKVRCFCPKCRQFFQQEDIVENNLARETIPDIELLHQVLVPILQVDVQLERIPTSNEFKTQLDAMNFHFNSESKSNLHPLKTPSKTTRRSFKTQTESTPGEAPCEALIVSSEGTCDKTVPINIFLHDGVTYHINYLKKMAKPNAKGEIPLHLMCKRKQLEKVQASLRNKVDLNAQDFAGWTPLHEAVQSKSIDIVKELLIHGALPNIPGMEYITPLHKAAILGDEKVIKLLLEYGANKNSRDYSGKKPLEYISDESIKQIFEETKQCMDVPKQLFYPTNIVAYCYYIEDSYREKLRKTKTKIEEEYNFKKVTHFILRKNLKMSLKILIAMLRGTKIVPQEWLDDFINQKYFIPVSTYTYVHNEELNKGIQKAMLNSMLKLPPLFSGMKFYIRDHKDLSKIHNIKMTKQNISELVIAGGGQVLIRQPTTATCSNVYNYPYHSNITDTSPCCDFILFDENDPPALQYQMPEIKHKTSRWLLDCIMNFTILP